MALSDTARVKEPGCSEERPAQAVEEEKPIAIAPGAGILEVSKRGAAGEAPQKSDDDEKSKYRYRDGSGLIFGPMGVDTLVNLLRVRRPRSEDRVSVDDGPWTSLEQVSEIELDDVNRPGNRRAERQAATEVEAQLTPDRKVNVASQPEDTQVMAQASPAGGERDGDGASPQAHVIEASRLGLADSSTDIAVPPELGNASTAVDENVQRGGDAQESPESSLKELKEQYASYQGELNQIPFARILARLHLVQETGRLHVHHGEVEKSIYFRDGEPIFVQSNRKEELLGHFLRSRDLITEQQLEKGLDRLSEWGGRLGDALVAIGAIPAHSIFEHLSAQMREKLLEIFTWDNGQYGYYENQEPDTQAYSLGVDTFAILVDGCREYVSIDKIRDRYEHRSFVGIFVNDPPPFSMDQLGLRARELRVLNQLEPGDNLERLIDKFSPEQEEMIYRMIYLFHQAEVISFEVTEKYDTPPLPEG